MLHRNTWITEADFDMMATLGINAVRLPIGYWVVAQTQVMHPPHPDHDHSPNPGHLTKPLSMPFQHLVTLARDREPHHRPNTAVKPRSCGVPMCRRVESRVSQAAAYPFVEGGLAYVDLAMQWGAKYGIGVLIDLHAAPGSQNGQTNSAPPCCTNQLQELWDAASQPTPNYAAQSVSVMGQLAQRYTDAPALLGFGLLNQPTVRGAGTPRHEATPGRVLPNIIWMHALVCFWLHLTGAAPRPCTGSPASMGCTGSFCDNRTKTFVLHIPTQELTHQQTFCFTTIWLVRVWHVAARILDGWLNCSYVTLQVSNLTYLQNYYRQAYAAIRTYSPSCFVAITPRANVAAEQNGKFWQFFMTGPGYNNVLQDLHMCAAHKPSFQISSNQTQGLEQGSRAAEACEATAHTFSQDLVRVPRAGAADGFEGDSSTQARLMLISSV